jgi:hypothetical protein
LKFKYNLYTCGIYTPGSGSETLIERFENELILISENQQKSSYSTQSVLTAYTRTNVNKHYSVYCTLVLYTHTVDVVNSLAHDYFTYIISCRNLYNKNLKVYSWADNAIHLLVQSLSGVHTGPTIIIRLIVRIILVI